MYCEFTYKPEDGDGNFIRNFGKNFPIQTALHLRGPASLAIARCKNNVFVFPFRPIILFSSFSVFFVT